MTSPSPRPLYPSDHKDGGYNARDVAKKTAGTGVRIGELAAEILSAVTDGTGDDRRVIRAAGELSEIAVHLCMIQWSVADGDYSTAKKTALKLANSREKVG